MSIEQLNVKVDKLRNMSFENSIKEFDNIYSKMKELLELNNPFINYKVLEISKQVYNEARVNNVNEEYKKTYIFNQRYTRKL